MVCTQIRGHNRPYRLGSEGVFAGPLRIEHPFGTLKYWMGSTHFLNKTVGEH